MKKKKICAITDLNHLNELQVVSVIKEFIHLPCDNPFYITSVADFNKDNTEHYRNLVLNSEKWKSLTDVVQLKSEYLLLCFDAGDNFVCMRDQVKFSSHGICLPENLDEQLKENPAILLSSKDKCCLLYQLSIADDNLMLELTWHQLCVPQMLSVSQFLGLNLSLTQVQNSQHPSNFIEAKCRQSRNFRENYGAGSNFKYATFSYCIEDILTILGISLNFPSSQPPEDAANGDTVTKPSDVLQSSPGKLNHELFEPPGLATIEDTPYENFSTKCYTEKAPKLPEQLCSPTSENGEPKSVIPCSQNASQDNSSNESYETGAYPEDSDASKEVSYDSAIGYPSPISQSTPLIQTNAPVNNRKVHSVPACDSLELCRPKKNTKKISKSKSKNSYVESSEDESILERQLMVDNELVIQMEPCGKQHIKHDHCITCNQYCKNLSLKCYVCERKVHYTCYETQGSKPLSEEDFFASTELSNHRWFCNKCAKLSMNDILARATEKIRFCIQNSCEFISEEPPPICSSESEVGSNSYKEQNSPARNSGNKMKNVSVELHYSDISQDRSTVTPVPFKVETCDIVVEKVNQCITEKISELKDFIAREAIGPPQKTYADISKENMGRQIPMEHSKTPLTMPIHPSHENIQSSTRVNKQNSLVIRNVQDRKFIKDASSIKKEFNKHFQKYKVLSAFPTRSGALIIELPTHEDATWVLQNWKSSFFCPDNKTKEDKYKTSCEIMANMQSFKVILRDVEYGLSDDRVSQELSREYPQATFQRFVTRQGRALKTGIITLKEPDHLTQILDEGRLHLCSQSMMVFRYIPRRKVIQCYNCKQFDHVKKWCPNNYSCSHCSRNHVESDCRNPEDLKCTNCKGAHSSLDKQCSVYARKSQINNVLLSRNDHE